MAPTPEKIGRNQICAPLKYSASRPARINVLRKRFISKWRTGYGVEEYRNIAEETVSRANGRSWRAPSHFRFDRSARVCFLSDSDRAGWRMRGLFRWSGKWWPGVIPLLILWGLAAWNSTAPLETDLAGR